MKITIEVNDITLLINALNNAMIAYNDVVMSIYFCCDISEKFMSLKEMPFENLRARQESLKNVYKQLEKIEQKEMSK